MKSIFVWGLISGALSYVLALTFSLPGLIMFPGIIFGIFILHYLHSILSYEIKRTKEIGFLILSTGGYLTAYYITTLNIFTLNGNVKLFISGIIGSFILSLGISLLGIIKKTQITPLVLLGGLLSQSFSLTLLISPIITILGLSTTSNTSWLSIFFLFIIWQTGMMLLIEHFARKNLNTKKG